MCPAAFVTHVPLHARPCPARAACPAPRPFARPARRPRRAAAARLDTDAPGAAPGLSERSDAATEPDAPPPPESVPLPASSRAALYSSVALALSALVVPLGLAAHDAAAAHAPLAAYLGAYGTHFAILALTLGFGVLHSGLASLRPRAVRAVGERAYRVCFALASLPSATAVISYFVAHRYDGVVLAEGIRSLPFAHDVTWGLTFVSFLFLYPATFNLLEVATVQRPGFRIYEKGITRVTRHPQLFGQFLWCVAHTAWLDSSFALVASLGLVAHHAFGAWNGDRRLRDRFGAEWAEYAERTSIVPFAAALSGKQTLRASEFLRPAYVGVVLATLGFYAAHPAMVRLVAQLGL